MRLRLMIAMLVVVGITIASVVGFAVVSTKREVNVYMFRGGMYGLNEMVDRLEEYYNTNGNWKGASKLMDSPGMMMGNPANGAGMMANQGSGSGYGGGRNQNATPPPQAATPVQNVTNDNIPPDPAPQSHLILTDADGVALTRFRGKEDIALLTADQMDQAIPLEDKTGNVVGYLYTDETAPIQPGREQALTEKVYSSVQKAALIGVGIAILLSLLLGYWFLQPVNMLIKAAGALGQGDLNQRVKVKGKDELAILGKTFNDMAESLKRAEDSRKAMTADIAHELRTPLAVQRATVEAMMDGVYPMDEKSLKPVMEQNVLLSHLVDDLRTLALADAGELRLEKVNMNVAKLVESVIHRFESQASRQMVNLNYTLAPDLPRVHADPIRVEQIMTNLIGNALRFTPENGRIDLNVEMSGQTIEIRIKDSGPGIPEESLPYIFDRFYRVDKSRSRGEGGSGLGLAIARHLAHAHNGDITARNHPSGGAEFSLSLPI